MDRREMNEDFAAGWRTQKTWKCDPQRAVNICESKAWARAFIALHPNELNVKMSKRVQRVSYTFLSLQANLH